LYGMLETFSEIQNLNEDYWLNHFGLVRSEINSLKMGELSLCLSEIFKLCSCCNEWTKFYINNKTISKWIQPLEKERGRFSACLEHLMLL